MARDRSRDTRQIGSGSRRAEWGCIVSFENADGKTLTMHRAGPPGVGLRNACLTAFALDKTFKVVSYSTPQTIFGDLDGARQQPQDNYGRNSTGRKPHPETQVMGKIKMRHMVHPRLLEARRLPAQ